MIATYHYRSRRPEQALLRKRIREIAETRMRYGYRRITVLLHREGWHVNVKRVRRLYRLEGLQMRLKPPRRRVMAKLRDDRSVNAASNFPKCAEVKFLSWRVAVIRISTPLKSTTSSPHMDWSASQSSMDPLLSSM